MPLRVLHVIAKFVRRAGPERLLLDLVSGLDPAQFESSVALLDFRRFEGPSLAEEALGPSGRVALLPWRKTRLLADTVWRFARLVHDWRIDVIHCHDIPSDLIAMLGSGLGRRRPGLISSRHGYIDFTAKLRLMGWLDNRLLTGFDRVVIAVDALRQTLPRSMLGRVAVIPNAVNVDRVSDPEKVAQLRQQLGIAPGAPVVLAVGRASPEKGHRNLVEAVPALCARHPGVRVVIVGEGPLLPELRDRAHRLGVSGTLVLPGFIEDADAAFEMCDVFVQPSLSESFALAVFEAMAWARPVVTTRVGGMAEYLSDGVTARLVPAGDAPALADAVGELLANPAERARLGMRGRELVVEHYSDRAFVATMGALYRDVATERGRPGD